MMTKFLIRQFYLSCEIKEGGGTSVKRKGQLGKKEVTSARSLPLNTCGKMSQQKRRVVEVNFSC